MARAFLLTPLYMEPPASSSLKEQEAPHAAVPMPPLPANKVLRQGHDAKKLELLTWGFSPTNFPLPLQPIRTYAGGLWGKLGRRKEERAAGVDFLGEGAEKIGGRRDASNHTVDVMRGVWGLEFLGKGIFFARWVRSL